MESDRKKYAAPISVRLNTDDMSETVKIIRYILLSKFF